MDISIILAPVATAVIGGLVGALRESRRRSKEHDAKRESEHEALCMGMCELMRTQLYQMHTYYVVDGHSMPYGEKERAESVYKTYHALGGNGTGTHVYEELMAAYVEGRND